MNERWDVLAAHEQRCDHFREEHDIDPVNRALVISMSACEDTKYSTRHATRLAHYGVR
jgi:hypothetical protein